MFKKNDIKNLPFHEIPKRVLEIKDRLEDERLAVIQSAIEASNNKKVAMYTKDAKYYWDSESGSDGIEEAVLEVAHLQDPEDAELTPEQKTECYNTAVKEVCTSFLAAYELPVNYEWVMPQMRAHFGNWKFIDGDGLKTVRENCQDDFNRGLWYIAQRPRSELIDGKSKKVRLYSLSEYNNLVPLILSGFKTYQGVAYSRWKRESLRWVVDEDLCDAMLSEAPKLTSDEAIALREFGLKIQTGHRSGQMRDPQTTAMIYGMQKHPDARLVSLPKYTLVMLAQIWCAHPVNRSPNMVLDPNDWDTMPPPVVQADLFNTSPKFTKPTVAKKPTTGYVPW